MSENKKAEIAQIKKGLIKPGVGRKKRLKVEEEIILTLYYLQALLHRRSLEGIVWYQNSWTYEKNRLKTKPKCYTAMFLH